MYVHNIHRALLSVYLAGAMIMTIGVGSIMASEHANNQTESASLTTASLISRPKAVLFDWDNTIVDTWLLLHQGMCNVFEKRGREPWSLQQTKDLFHESIRDAFPKHFPDDWEDAINDFHSYSKENHLRDLTLLPYTREIIEILNKLDIPIGIVSNKDKGLVLREIEYFGFSTMLGAVVGSGDAAFDKPHSAPVLFALEQLGISPSNDTWMIGDTPVDWQAAKSAGIFSIAVCPQQVVALPDRAFTNLKPIFDFLNTMQSQLSDEIG